MNITSSVMTALILCTACKDKKETTGKTGTVLRIDTNRLIHIDSFWMDESEINSNEYRQFVIKDSAGSKEQPH